MKWQLKAALQRAIALLPASESINYFFQKRVTKNLPVSDETLQEKIGLARKRVAIFRKFREDINLSDAHFMEFGAGWDMIGPLATYDAGIRKQTLLDITPHLRFELINNAISRFEKNGFSFPALRVRSKDDLLEYFGIDYRAPLDAVRTGFPENSIDYISTNSTLEHIPEAALVPIMQESFRILKPNGLICHLIDMKDHYSYFDTSISKYNFLKYSDLAWKIYNSPMQYQNRLRLPYYRELIRNAGFEIIAEEIQAATDSEISELRKMKIDPQFKIFSEQDISEQIYTVVARKPA